MVIQIMTDPSYTNLIRLLKAEDYTPYEYFILDNYCFIIKVIHTSGSFFGIRIPKKYRITVPDELQNKYVISKQESPVNNVSSKYLTEYYPGIELQTNVSEDVGRMNDKIIGSYKQPIVIQSSSSSHAWEQLNRLKYCFQMLEYKMFIQDQFYLSLLTSENTLAIYKIQNYPKTHERIYFVVLSLEQFYSKIKGIHNTIEQIEDEFRHILDINQKKHQTWLNTNYVEHFISNNAKILQNKQIMVNSKQDIIKMLADVSSTENKLLKEKENMGTKTSHNVFQDADQAAQKEILNEKLTKVHNLKLNLLDKIITLNSKIKDIYLIVDQLGFNLSLSLNELRSELSNLNT